jgi:hypothetical protein
VILHLSYTAREAGGTFRSEAVQHVKDFLANSGGRSTPPLAQMFNLRTEFATEWRAFLHPAGDGDEQVLRFTIGNDRMPFLARSRTVVISRIELFARSTVDTAYEGVLTTIAHGGSVVESDVFEMPRNPIYGDLNKITLAATDFSLDLEEMDLSRELALKVRRDGEADFASLPEDELREIYIVLRYRLA